MIPAIYSNVIKNGIFFCLTGYDNIYRAIYSKLRMKKKMNLP